MGVEGGAAGLCLVARGDRLRRIDGNRQAGARRLVGVLRAIGLGASDTAEPRSAAKGVDRGAHLAAILVAEG
jgi:hypothetical protein